MTGDPELEDFLRQFRPIAPGPLRLPPARRARRWALPLLAAVVVAVALGIALTPRLARGPGAAGAGRTLPTVGALRVAVRDGTYPASLDEMEAGTLSDPGRPGSALAVLADVRRDW